MAANNPGLGVLPWTPSPKILLFCDLPVHGRDFQKWMNVHTATRRVCLHYGLKANLSGVPSLQRHSLRHWVTRVAHERCEIAALALARVGKRTMAWTLCYD
jgi:hypothetical protein